MVITHTELKDSLNKAYRLIKPKRQDLNTFKANLKTLLSHIDEKEREENVKNHLMTFLRDTFYQTDYLINTKELTDFVIHLGKDSKAPAGVLFEVKKPTNKADMITKDNLNAKAMHELILYFLRERLNNNNNSLTHLVITNVYEWFVFDAQLFERVFRESKQLQTAYKDWASGQKVSNKTDLFYKEIAKPFIDQLKETITFTYFDIRTFKKQLDSTKDKDDNKLIPLFKFFTPVHLLKLSFLNDSNSLDKGFFSELLHIIGLKEIREKGGRKFIDRMPERERQPGSMIENTINILEVENTLARIPHAQMYGKTREEQLFHLSLELCITWVNRILFLKLLEAQLIKYHQEDKKYRFLNSQTISDYDELYKLFFQVLARQNEQRSTLIQQKFGHIPYLNSSLFEISPLEEATIKINGLDGNMDMEIYATSILRKRVHQRELSQTQNTLHYFFQFLEAYDFASVGKEEVQEENKTIINAAVLGLVFEKINGYRDGSIYTPGAVTMFLCQETIRKAVVKKFNDKYTWNCSTIADVKNYLSDRRKTEEVLADNKLVDSVKIVDPAVGSGHFLVSSLNELIAIKGELGILADANGNRLAEIEVGIAQDELVITYAHSGNFFEYSVKEGPGGTHVIPQPVQRIQQTLFNEKRKIIENCLFGVDINPNSVKICQLRLWIELLKHAYYKTETEYRELETLPNIDINIKHGNSLLSKYSLQEDLSEVFKKQDFGPQEYQKAVHDYKEAHSKSAKNELQAFIQKIKKQFHETVSRRDPRRKKLADQRGQLALAHNNIDLFGKKRSEKDMELEVRRITLNIEKQEMEIHTAESNIIYRNAFEWRFEFPEVLNSKGDFEGFEVVLGNPPYIQLQKMGSDADALQKMKYDTFVRTGDIYCLFYEQAIRLLKKDYFFGFITSNKWMRANYGQAIRKFFLEKTNPLLLVDFGGYQVFESATVDTNLLIAQKSPYLGQTQTCLLDKTLGSLEKMSDYVSQNKALATNFSGESGWVILSEIETRIKQKVEAIGTPLKEWDIQINYGIKTGFNEAFIIDGQKRAELLEKCPKADEIIRPILRGRDIKKYKAEFADQWMIFIPWHFPLQNDISVKGSSNEAEKAFRDSYPDIYNHLIQFKEPLSKRNPAETGKRYEWYALQRFGSNYWPDFNKEKIVWIELTNSPKFAIDTNGYYLNNTIFFMTGNHLKYLLSYLNSRLCEWHFDKIAATSGAGTRRWIKIYIDQICAPKPDLKNESDINDLIDNAIKNQSNENLEKIDAYFYKVFNLDVLEIETIISAEL